MDERRKTNSQGESCANYPTSKEVVDAFIRGQTGGVAVAGGKKFDNGKPPMELLSHNALVEISKVFGVGAVKYGRYNYKNGLSWSRVIGAAYRHLGAFNSGEDIDLESGLSHIAHLGCCVIMLLDYIRMHPELDDRYKPPV
jgi:hypothetical protein